MPIPQQGYIVLYAWKPKYLHIIFSYYIHVKNEGRSLLGFSPPLIFLARTIECAEQEHIFVNFDEKGFFLPKKVFSSYILS